MSPEPIAEQARSALRRHVLEPLATRCLDREYGGFLVDFDECWRPRGPHVKSLEHAARTTGVFALLHRVMPGEGCDRLALHGCDFLRQIMWDGDYGGFFARVDRQGRPLWDGLKHPHAATYTAEAFHLCRDLLPSGVGALWVENALNWLDEVAWDPVHGGYWGCYRRDNQRYLQGDQLPTGDGRDPLGVPPGLKEINTQSDALEMLALVAADNHKPGARCLDWLVALVKDRLIDSAGALPYAYRRDWRLAPFGIQIGHQFQTSRRLAPLARGSNDLLETSCRLVDFCLASARHPSGGFCYAITRRRPLLAKYRSAADGPRGWWVQFEAINALHVLACHDLVAPQLRARYRAERDQQWEFLRRHYFDNRHGGVREEPSAAPGRSSRVSLRVRSSPRATRPPALKSHAWKDASHETKALLTLGFESP